jgi:hypothetical protein
VATDVVKGAHHLVLATDDDGPFAAHVEADVVAGLRQVVHMADKLPVPPEQDIGLEVQQFLVEIGPARESGAVPIARDFQIFQ